MTQQSMAIQKHSPELWMELWIGTGKTIQCIPVHQVIQSLGPGNSVALPLVHSYTGCDTSSSFLGIRKNTAWAAWEVYAELTETLIDLSEYSTLLTIHSIHMARLKRWAVIMYSKSLGCSRVYNARCQLFTHGTRMLDHTPPTPIFPRRALLLAAFIWRQVKESQQHVQEISQWGWMQEKRTKNWLPFWTELSGANSAILHHCGCTQACRGS